MIADVPRMFAVLSYCRAHRLTCHAVYSGGMSVELLGLTHAEALIKFANGEERTVPAAHVYLSTEEI